MKTSPYPDPRIVMRKPRQRYDRSILPSFVFLNSNGELYDEHQNVVGTGIVCGTFRGVDGFGRETTYEAIQVTLTDGTVVPAYRKKSPEGNYAVCQRFGYKAAFPQPAHAHPATGGTHG